VLCDLNETVLLVIILFGSLFLLSYVFKSIVKAIIISLVIVLLFKIGFLWTTEDLKETKFFKILAPEPQEKIERFYDDYSKKRDKQSIFRKDKIPEYFK
jgi:uncharacterized membrane protein YraQ (UPF0718 family)